MTSQNVYESFHKEQGDEIVNSINDMKIIVIVYRMFEIFCLFVLAFINYNIFNNNQVFARQCVTQKRGWHMANGDAGD
jgi:hypothetical protein